MCLLLSLGQINEFVPNMQCLPLNHGHLNVEMMIILHENTIQVVCLTTCWPLTNEFQFLLLWIKMLIEYQPLESIWMACSRLHIHLWLRWRFGPAHHGMRRLLCGTSTPPTSGLVQQLCHQCQWNTCISESFMNGSTKSQPPSSRQKINSWIFGWDPL